MLWGLIDVSPDDFLSWIKKIPFLKKKITKTEVNILFVDDQEFPVVDNLTTSGWNAKRVEDITNIESDDIKRAHIIFVDYKGVGKILAESEEGIGLIRALMEKYKNSKRIILYSGHGNFSLGKHLQVAHNQMAKNSDSYEFITMIESELKRL